VELWRAIAQLNPRRQRVDMALLDAAAELTPEPGDGVALTPRSTSQRRAGLRLGRDQLA
jgi:hypothetical protein